YFTKTKAIALKRQLWTDNTSIIELKETETQDIDTLEDWTIAEMKFKLLNDPKT
ncbi:MAG: N-acylneuraminate cytidylyltransferase, partial [Bacteroidia bacterium]